MAPHTQSTALEPNPYLGCVVGLRDDDQHAVSLRMRGELCAVTASEHSRQLTELVDRGYIQLRIELEELSLCTSDGLDLWDDLQHRLEPLAGTVTLAGATGVVRRVLDVVTSRDRHFCPKIEVAA
jgi:hypothetical protein